MESRKKKSITVLGLLSLLLVIIGVTYVAFSYSKVGTNENTISTSTISMSYTEGDNKITIDNVLQTEDEVGKTLTEEGQVFDFTVSNGIMKTIHVTVTTNRYTIEIENEKGEIEEIEVKYNENYNLPTLEKEGYEFVGWFTEENGGGNQITNDMSTDDTIKKLYPHFIPKEYEISFDKQDGTESDKIKVTYDSVYENLPILEREGYTFGGWYLDTDYTEEIRNGDIVKIIDNTNLYAKWIPNKYTVTLDGNGGSVTPTSIEVTYNYIYSGLPTLTRTGYTFAGWFTAASEGSQITNSTKVSITSNQTLYAHWNINSYGVTINTSNANKSTGSLNINYGGNGTVTITPTSGYYLSGASCTNGYTTNAQTGTSKTGAQIVTIYNNSKTTGSTCTFTGTKSVNQNISSPPACVTSGICSSGTSINYKVNGSTTQSFYVLKDNGSTLTLISSSMVATSVAWDSSGNNKNGPRTANQKLESVTSSWTNVPANTYNEKTGTATRARLITKEEAESVGCTTSIHSCPTWITDSNYYHWTSTATSNTAATSRRHQRRRACSHYNQ